LLVKPEGFEATRYLPPEKEVIMTARLRRRKRSCRPFLEILEDRTAPSVSNFWTAAAASDHDWNTGSNWSLGNAPTSGEIATFGQSGPQNSVVDCTINSGTNTCDGILITNFYTGTITASADLSLLTTAGYIQTGGTFNLSSSTIHDMGVWMRSLPFAGTFSAGTGTVDFNLASGSQTEINAGNPFFNLTHSGAGTLQLSENLTANNALLNSAGTLDALGHNISVTGLTTITGSTSNVTNTGAADTLTFTGGLSMTGGKLSSGLGTIDLGSGVTAVSDASGSALIGGKLNLGSSVHVFTINPGPQTIDLSIAATISDAGPLTPGGIDKTGAGVLALTATNTYTGGTTIDNGTLVVSADGALGPGTTEMTTINGGGTLSFSGGVNYATPESVKLMGGNLISDIGAGTTDTFSGPVTIGATGSFIRASMGSTLHLTGSTISLNSFALNVAGVGDTILDDMLSGTSSASLTKSESGALTLNAANTYGGGGVGTDLMGGTLAIGNDGAIGAGLLTLEGGTTLLAAGGTHSLANKVSLTGTATIGGVNSLALNGSITGAGALIQTDSATLLLGGANSFGGGITVNAGSLALGTDTAAGSGTMTFNNSVTLIPANSPRTLANAITLGASADLTVAGTFDLTLNSAISGPTGSIAHSSPNVLTLNGANSFGGGLTMMAGTLSVGTDTALGTGTFVLDDGTLMQAVGGARTLSNNATFNNRVTITGSNDLTLTGVIGSGGSMQQLTMVGSGTAILTGNNSALTDSIIVNAGAFYVNGQQPSTPVSVNVGALFGGSGAVGAITVNRGALSPGTPSGPGILSSGSVQFMNPGCTFSVQIAGPAVGSGYSQLNVTGTVNLGVGNVALSVAGPFVPQPGNTFEIVNNDGVDSIMGTFAGLPDGSTVPFNGVNMTIHYSGGTGNDITLSVAPAKSSIVGRNGATGQWWMAASTGSSFTNSLWTTWNPHFTWVDVQTGDFNGDGHADLVGRAKETGQWWVALSNGSNGFSSTLWTTWNPAFTWVDVKVGDFNGDGKADIVGRALETGQWWVAKSTSASFTNSLWATWNTALTWVDVNVGDFNGDGKADITGRDLQAGSWWTGISTGSMFMTTSWTTWNPAFTWVDVKVGDFDGNGKADLVGRALENGQWWVALSDGDSFSNTLWATWNTAATWVDVKVGDFDGDGKTDITGRWSQTGGWWTGLSTGTSFATSKWATWNTALTWVDVEVGDFNGDGKDDIAGRSQQGGSWFVGVSQGTVFTTSPPWVTWNTAVKWVDVQNGRYL
jgi:autotransporter-associated beta strand protein